MGWPLSQDYNEAIQSASTTFSDPDFGGGQVVLGPMGLPLPRSGNFADVYQFKGKDGTTWAVKCFTRHVEGLQERYSRIDQHLNQAGLPFTVGFQFLEQGIRIRGTWYPILKMEWVEGFTLNEFVRKHADHPPYLRALLSLWVRLSKRLRDAKVAHADLQHGNVLLVPGAAANKLGLKLIDYDGMWVPPLAKKPSGEAGHPAFQHPARLRDRIYSPDVDRFPHLVIACALRATAIAGKAFWDRFDNGDNLLFREVDLADPASSKLIKALWALDDPTVTNLLALLVLSTQRGLRDTPWLDEVLVGDQAAFVSDTILGRAADLIGVPRRSVRKAAPAAQVFVATDETNEFADIYENDDPRLRPAPLKPKKTSMLPLVAAIGLATVAAAVVFAVVFAKQGEKPITPNSDGDKPAVVENPDSKTDIPEVKKEPFTTDWAKVASGPAWPTGKSLPATAKQQLFLEKDREFFAAQFLPDGQHGVLAARDRIYVVDLLSGERQIEFPKEGDFGTFSLMTTSPDGTWAITVGRDHEVRCWNLTTGSQVWSKTFPGEASALAATRDGRRVGVSGDGVGYVEWLLADGSEVRRHEALQATLLLFTPDGQKAVVRSRGKIEIWNLDDATIQSLAPPFAATSLALSVDGTTILATGPGLPVKAWSIADGTMLEDRPIQGVRGSRSVAVTSEADLVYVNGLSGKSIIPLATDVAPTVVTAQATAIVFSPDNKHALVVSPTKKGPVFLTNVTRGDGQLAKKEPASKSAFTPVKTLPIPDVRDRFAVDLSGKYYLVGLPKVTTVYEMATDREVAKFTFTDLNRRNMAFFGPDESLIVGDSFGGQQRLRRWDWATDKFGPPFELKNLDTLFLVEPFPERPWVIVQASPFGSLIYNVRTGERVDGWPISKDADFAVHPSPDGKWVACVDPYKGIRLWDCDTATTTPLLASSQGATQVSFSPDGKKLVGVWSLGRIRVWDVLTGNFEFEVPHEIVSTTLQVKMFTQNLAMVSGNIYPSILQLSTGKLFEPNDKALSNGQLWMDTKLQRFYGGGGENSRTMLWKWDNQILEQLPEGKLPPSKNLDQLFVRDALYSPCVGAAFINDGDKFVVGYANGKLFRYQTANLLGDGEFDGDDVALKWLVKAKDRLFTLGTSSGVRVWKIDGMKVDKTFGIPAKPEVNYFAVKPDGNSFLVASDKLRWVNVKTRAEEIVPKPPRAGTLPLTQFAFAETAAMGVARWGNNYLGTWQPMSRNEGQALKTTGVENASANAFAITPDGKTAVMLMNSGKVRSWDTKTGKMTTSELIHKDDGNGPNFDLELLPNGTHFLTVGNDGKVILWELNGLKQIKVYSVQLGSKRLCVAPNQQAFLVISPNEMRLMKLPELAENKP